MADELDFDELHKAVNQIMTGKGKSKRATPVDVSRPAPKDDDDPTPKPSDDNDGPVKVQVRRPAPALSVPSRRRGVAMDIVSAPAPAPAPPVRASRTGITLQPTQEVKPEPPKPTTTPPREMAAKPGEPTDAVLASLDMKDEDDVPSGAPKSDRPDVDNWPDPLDFHGFKEDGYHDEAKVKPPKDDEKALPEPHDALIEAHEPSQPEESEVDEEEAAPTMSAERPEGTPFIDAKVEKRPLGAYTSTPKETPKAEAPEVPAQPALSSQPKEFSPEVVAVESAESETHGQDEETDLSSVRQMSIPPQYHARDKEPSKAERPVFDTREYHTPIDPAAAKTPAPKRKSMAGIIVLLLLLVVAAGVAYLWMTGMLDLSYVTKLF